MKKNIRLIFFSLCFVFLGFVFVKPIVAQVNTADSTFIRQLKKNVSKQWKINALSEDIRKQLFSDDLNLSLEGDGSFMGPCEQITPIGHLQTLNGALTAADCNIEDGSYIDFYSFNGTVGQKVTINMTSTNFDSFLYLINQGQTISTDDDSGGNGNARINLVLPNSGNYTIGANAYNPNTFGNYSVSFASSGVARGTPFDFGGDGKTDVSVFRPSNATWYRIDSSSAASTVIPWGNSSDKLVPADYDGDGKTDIAVYNGSSWLIRRSSNSQTMTVAFGASGDIPVPADFDGDGKDDISLYRPSNSVWYRLNSSDNQFVANSWGLPGDQPIIGDFDGDGKADLCVYRPSNNVWYRINSSDNQFAAVGFGSPGDLTVPADYDGDKKTDVAVFRPSNSIWYRFNSSNNAFAAVSWGISTDKPVPTDYDGDGKADVAVYRDGTWYIITSSNSALYINYVGVAGDIPLPYVYVH